MLFTLKLLRFLFGLALKVVLFPILLPVRLIRMATSNDTADSEFGFDDPAGSSSDGTGGGSLTNATNSVGGGSNTHSLFSRGIWMLYAPKREQFRNALVLYAVLGSIGGFLLYDQVQSAGYVRELVRFQLGFLVPLVFGGFVWFGLNRRERVAWYASIAWTVVFTFAYFDDLFGWVPWWIEVSSWGLWYLLEEFAFLQNALVLLLGGSLLRLAYQTRPSTWTPQNPRPGSLARMSESNPSSGTPSPSAGGSTSSSSTEPSGGVGSAIPESKAATSDSASGETSGQSRSGTEPSGTDDGSTADSSDDGSGTDSSQAVSATVSETEPDRVESSSRAGPTESVDSEPGQREGATDAVASDTEEQSTNESIGGVSSETEYIAGLDSDSVGDRVEAVRDLGEAVDAGEAPPEVALNALTAQVRDDEATEVRVALCEVLGTIGTAAARDVLADLRLDPDSDVSRAATRTINELETDNES